MPSCKTRATTQSSTTPQAPLHVAQRRRRGGLSTTLLTLVESVSAGEVHLLPTNDAVHCRPAHSLAPTSLLTTTGRSTSWRAPAESTPTRTMSPSLRKEASTTSNTMFEGGVLLLRRSNGTAAAKLFAHVPGGRHRCQGHRNATASARKALSCLAASADQ